MGSFITDLKNSFNKGNIYIQFIYINVGVFIVTSLLGILWMLFNRNGAFVLQYLELPAWTLQFVKQPWSLLTYMFMHAGILHLLFNMLWLYWFGQIPRALSVGRYLWRFVVYDRLQCFPLFQ